MAMDSIYDGFSALVVGGMTYPPAIVYEKTPRRVVRNPVGREVNERTWEPLFVLPGGGRATEREIRGAAGC